MYFYLRKLLFLLPPECSHDLTLALLPVIYPAAKVRTIQAALPKKPLNLFGLQFPNPIGLAAGLDKNGDCIDALFGLGFGFIEVGAVTPQPEPGNPKPRLFRVKSNNALINQMGFNNRGVDYVVTRLKKRKTSGIVGVNLGKNRATPLENANQDYLICFEKVYPVADYVSINISSPNTENLQLLQSEKYLESLLNELIQCRKALRSTYNKEVPILLKVSADLTNAEIDSMARVLLQTKIDGIITVNTTRDRSPLPKRFSGLAGGLSGPPLFDKMLRVMSRFKEKTLYQIPIVAVGGIDSIEKAKKALQSGASLIQIYTGLIYEGPKLIKQLIEKL